MIKNFIWDLDGTLADTYPVMVLALRQSLFIHNVPAPDDLLTPLLQHSIRWFVHNEVPDAQQKHVYTTYQQLEHELQAAPPLYENAKKVLKTITKHGGQNFIATHRNHVAKDILENHNVLRYFNDIITSEDGFARKPNPAMLDYLLARHHLDPAETVMIGDRPLDIVMGQNAHVKTCLFNPNAMAYEVSADYAISNLSEILTIGR